MIIKPKVRGFICTTAHPVGCAENVALMARYAQSKSDGGKGPKRVLVIGASTGYGLATRVAAAFGCGADTIGVFLERPGSAGRTASAGWYNNAALEGLAREKGLIAESVCGDAFSDDVKREAVRLVREKLGQVDFVVYSLAAPRRTDPVTGKVYQSVLKPIGEVFRGKTVNVATGELSEAVLEPAAPGEIEDTVAVMGGEDWLLWIQALDEAGLLADGIKTVAYTYIGPALTHAVYRNGTIGRAKEDLQAKAAQIGKMLSGRGGSAFLSVNKALVTQSSSAIPVVPLYIAILFKIMREKGTHEGCIQQMVRMIERIWNAGDGGMITDEAGRLRMDDWEMAPEVQREVDLIWSRINKDNLHELCDLESYRHEFYRLFGFETPGVDYGADLSEELIHGGNSAK